MATVVTAKGREIINNMIKGTGTEPKVIGWGTNPASVTAANTDIAPFTESAEARVTGTSSLVNTTTVNDTYQVVGTITATGTRAIREVFLSDSSTAPFSATVAAGGTVPGSSSGASTSLNISTNYTPANNTYIQVRNEIMQVTSGNGGTALTVVRMSNLAANIGGGGSNSSAITTGDAVTLGNPPGVSTANATLFVHADFSVINLSNGDSVQFTIKVQFS